jgi:hypothetical protein
MTDNRKVKIVSVALDDTELSRKVGKLVEKSKAKFINYGDDKRHFEIYDGAEKDLVTKIKKK